MHELVIANPHHKYVDLEDEEFKNIAIRRFLQPNPVYTQYLEIDAEFAEDFGVNLDDKNLLERIMGSKKKKKYMMHVRIYESKF